MVLKCQGFIYGKISKSTCRNLLKTGGNYVSVKSNPKSNSDDLLILKGPLNPQINFSDLQKVKPGTNQGSTCLCSIFSQKEEYGHQCIKTSNLKFKRNPPDSFNFSICFNAFTYFVLSI